MKKLLLASVSLNIILIACICAWYVGRYKPSWIYPKKEVLSYDVAIAKTIENLKYNKHTTKYYYFNLWALYCKPCIAEMPRLDSLAKHTTKSISWAYVTSDSIVAVFEFFRKKGKYRPQNFTLLNNQKQLIGAIFKKLKHQGESYPTHLIVDSTGKIIHYHSGYISSPQGDILLNQAIAKLQ